MLLNPADALTLEGYDASQLTTAQASFANGGVFPIGALYLFSGAGYTSGLPNGAPYVVPFNGEIYLASYKATRDVPYPTVSWTAQLWKNGVLADTETMLYAGALPAPGVEKALAIPVVAGDLLGARVVVNAAGLRAPWVIAHIRRAVA